MKWIVGYLAVRCIAWLDVFACIECLSEKSCEGACLASRHVATNEWHDQGSEEHRANAHDLWQDPIQWLRAKSPEDVQASDEGNESEREREESADQRVNAQTCIDTRSCGFGVHSSAHTCLERVVVGDALL